ncbi:MAG: hypothetical protein O3B13_17520 [Planctomycetota bacterium]|nr:hypothetical protein [Planctomycetota bacterium]
MFLKNLTIRAKLAAGDVLDKVIALLGPGQSSYSEQTLELSQLEDRVLLSVSPGAMLRTSRNLILQSARPSQPKRPPTPPHRAAALAVRNQATFKRKSYLTN